MPANRKVIWAEGILLGQQHFQQWDKYIQHQQKLVHAHTAAHNWGIAVLEYDESYLPQGIFHLIRCTALLEDGRWIDFNHTFDGPLTLDVPVESNGLLSLSLCLPRSESATGITGYPEPHGAAWQGVYLSVSDESDPDRAREVLLGKQNIHLIIDGQDQEGLTCLKIVELEYDVNQLAYKVNHHFIPPVLKMSASRCIVSWIATFKNKLLRYIKRLNEQKAKHRHVQNQFGYADFIYFNLIKTLTTHLPKFTVLQTDPLLHPFYLYEACMNLIGELCGYLDDSLVAETFPRYHHHDLEGVFSQLNHHFDDLIERIMPVNTIDVYLQRISVTQFQSHELSLQDLTSKQYCLALYHEDMNQTVINKILAQVKIAAPTKLTAIVQTFTQGIGFKYLTSPGKDLMAKNNHHYFLLDKQSKGWDDVISEQMIAIFVSQELSTLPFELISYIGG